MRFLTALPLVAALGAPVAVSMAASAETAPAPAAAPSPRADLVAALDVLRDWDARRARAWSDVDPGALRSLYVSDSRAGQADLRLLGAYAERGLVVDRLVTQVFAVRVLQHDPVTLRLRVFDRVAGGRLLESGQAVALPSSAPVTRTVTFRLVGGVWRVAEVSGSGPVPRAAQR